MNLKIRFALIALLSLTILISCDKKDNLVSDLENDLELKSDSASQFDLDGLIYMREEEKLAMDVYDLFYEEYGVRTFDFISNSENHHTNQILGLINFYGLTDPALPEAGMFSNQELQELYNSLVEQGSDSLIAGLIVGATIEEVDIVDLTNYIDQTTADTINFVYNNLRRASGYHLKAFVNQLAFRGYEYTPQYLSQEEFDAIMESSPGSGGSCGDTTVFVLTEAEEEAMIYLREEEKLAHDVYVYFFDMYGINTFDFISKSEQWHTERVLRLLEFYSIPDPANNEPGVFNNPELQALYNELIEAGSVSDTAALMVGALIEEVDIADIDDHLEIATSHSVITLLENLRKGSEAHLRAFVFRLSLMGIIYEPQVLTQEEYDSIING